jgi:hypothetical protein
MADATVWITAAEPALGWTPATFQNAYKRHATRLSQRAVEADLLGALILQLIELHPWTGTATQLLAALANLAPWHSRRQLPATPASLGQRLRRLTPDLRGQGISVGSGRAGHESVRMIHLQRAESADRGGGAVGMTPSSDAGATGTFDISELNLCELSPGTGVDWSRPYGAGGED